MKKYLFICSVNGWNRASDNGIMVILSDASVSGRNSGNNVGYDGYRNVMTNRPAIDGKSDTITDTLSVGMMDKSEYVKNASDKISLYMKYGIYPNDKLLVSYETQKQPLSTEQIQRLLQFHFDCQFQ